jgi:hypothetical protein
MRLGQSVTATVEVDAFDRPQVAAKIDSPRPAVVDAEIP